MKANALLTILTFSAKTIFFVKQISFLRKPAFVKRTFLLTAILEKHVRRVTKLMYPFSFFKKDRKNSFFS